MVFDLSSQLSPREQSAVAVAVENPAMSNREVARTIGAGPYGDIARRLGTNGDLRAHVRRIFDELGWDDRRLAAKWAQLADSKVVSRTSYKGVVTAVHHDEALDIQVKAAENIGKLKRLYPQTDEDAASRGAGPPSLILQLNLGSPAAPIYNDASVTVALGVPDAAEGQE